MSVCTVWINLANQPPKVIKLHMTRSGKDDLQMEIIFLKL